MKNLPIITLLFPALFAPVVNAQENQQASPPEKVINTKTCPPYDIPGMTYDATPIVDGIDLNKDGKLTSEEWRISGAPQPSFQMFTERSKHDYVTKEEFLEETPPNGIDLNCDGKITLEEFVEFGKQGPPGGPDTSPSGDEDTAKTIVTGSIWAVDKITSLTALNIAEGAVINAPEGHSLTMTVNGIETSIKEGSYSGNIILAPTEEIIVNFNNMGAGKTYCYRAAIAIEDGVYKSEKSVASAVTKGTVNNTLAKDVSITSAGDKFNGIIVRGEVPSSYSIVKPVIKLTGNGENDFAGYGAAIMSDGKAEVTIENARIINSGAVRTAIWVGGNSVTRVNNSYIEVHNGTLPEDYSWSWASGGFTGGSIMMEVPWMLGIIGNNRATIVVGNGTAYYTNTHIKAQSWGALSTDAVQDVHLYATNCLIETIESGYGAYADGAHDYFYGCTFNVKDYGLIMTRGSGLFSDSTVVNSDRIGIMTHNGSGTVTIEKGSVFNTQDAVIQVKSSRPTIIVDNAKLHSSKRLILQAMVNDDPNKNFGGPPGSGPQSSGMPGEPSPSQAPAGTQTPQGAPQGVPPGGGIPGDGNANKDVTAVFRNMTLDGDIITSMTSVADVVVTFENATITGAISTAEAEHEIGKNGEKLVMQDATDLYYLIGREKDTNAFTNDPYGMKVSLDAESVWTVDKDSYLTSLTLAESTCITAPQGYKVIMMTDGDEKPILAGTYTGKIELTVWKL